jgi:hypothetical protein
MIAVQDVHGVDGILSDDVQIGFPHIGADEFDESTAFLAKPDEELTQTLLFPVLDDKQQPLHALVDLIDKRQELAPLPVDFIDPEGRDAGEIHPRPSPDHRHLDRAKYALPARLETLRHLLPAQQLGPAGQEPGKTQRDRAFAQRPG